MTNTISNEAGRQSEYLCLFKVDVPGSECCSPAPRALMRIIGRPRCGGGGGGDSQEVVTRR